MKWRLDVVVIVVWPAFSSLREKLKYSFKKKLTSNNWDKVNDDD